MNRKNRAFAVAERMASVAFNQKLEMSTTYTLAAMILAMDKAHVKVNYDKWFQYFAEIYPERLQSDNPVSYIKKAEDIVGAEIEIHWT